jgi:hypothetical protein
MERMKAYKFKSSSQIDQVLDILLNKRLYCADWQKLNDPMEGRFSYFNQHDEYTRERIEAIIREKRRIKVCALSKSFKSYLLWAHYANGFDGFAVEVELRSGDSEIHEIDYVDTFRIIDDSITGSYQAIANEILSSKYKAWEYEEEVRILQQSEWYLLDRPVSRVIVGQRVKPALRNGLEIICEAKGIELAKINFGNKGNISTRSYYVQS